MKELTIEEKLEKAKMLYKDANADQRYILESLFPELAEIEDVRIRKRIIQALHGDVLDMEETTKAIAWLEKQGEHANFRNKIQIGDKVTRSEDGMLVNLSQLNRVAKPTDKVEQKIATWSEEDKKMCQETIDWFEKKCFPYALENENPARESINWLKSLKSRKQWKPSKEQMEALWNVYEGGEKQSALASLYNDLKKL